MKYLSFILLAVILTMGCASTTPKPKFDFSYDSVTVEFLRQAWELPDYVRVPKSQSDIIWGRAMNFIHDYAGMKIQIMNDYLIETYDPPTEYDYDRGVLYSYTVKKIPEVDSTEIVVDCNSSPLLWGNEKERQFLCIHNSQMLVYYLMHGEINPTVIAHGKYTEIILSGLEKALPDK